MQNRSQINLANTLFLILVPLVGLSGLIWMLCVHELHWATLLLAGIYTYISGVAITAGYHRLFSHRAYKAHPIVRLIFVLFGASVFEGSVLEWCTDHRQHHLYTDTNRDPYNIKRGFWFAHIGWLFTLDTSHRDFSNVDDLAQDPMLRFMHRYYLLIATFMGFVLPMGIAALWGDWLGGLLIAGALRIGLNQQATFCINSICHLFGKRNYSEKQSACDNWFTALFTYGEGFHNYHHQFPIDYRNGVRYFHYDPAKWLIHCLSWFGLAYDLKMISQQKIIQYRLCLEEQKLRESSPPSLISHLQGMITPLRDKVMNMANTIEELEKVIVDLKHRYRVQEKFADYKQMLSEYRQKLKQAKRELKHHLMLWGHLVKASKMKCA